MKRSKKKKLTEIELRRLDIAWNYQLEMVRELKYEPKNISALSDTSVVLADSLLNSLGYRSLPKPKLRRMN